MKRVILFKAKRVDNGEWVYGDLLTKYILHDGATIVEDKCINYEVIPETVCQFTGLLDRNEKKIWEGDTFHTGNPILIHTVVWHDTGFIGKQDTARGSYIGLEHWQYRLQLIGNIHN